MEIPKKDIKAIEKQSLSLLEQANTYLVKSTQDVENASEFLKKIRDTEKMVEEKRLEFTRPLNQSLRAINETFKILQQPLVQARQLITERILLWRKEEMARLAREEERRRKIQEAHAKLGHEVNAPVVLERPENKIGNAQVSKVWKFRVVDFSKVPDLYKEINNVAVNQAIREGKREIPGLEIYQEEQLSVVNKGGVKNE